MVGEFNNTKQAVKNIIAVGTGGVLEPKKTLFFSENHNLALLTIFICYSASQK
jgi:hypothetical protein